MPSLNADHASPGLLHSLPTGQGSCYHALILIHNKHALVLRRTPNGDWYLLDSELDRPIRLNASVIQSLKGARIIAIKGGDCISYLPSTRASPLWLGDEVAPLHPHTHATTTATHMQGLTQSFELNQEPSVPLRSPSTHPHRQAPP